MVAMIPPYCFTGTDVVKSQPVLKTPKTLRVVRLHGVEDMLDMLAPESKPRFADVCIPREDAVGALVDRRCDTRTPTTTVTEHAFRVLPSKRSSGPSK